MYAFIHCQGRFEHILEWADELLKKNVGLGGRMDWTGWMYTPLTAMTTRATAVLKNITFKHTFFVTCI